MYILKGDAFDVAKNMDYVRGKKSKEQLVSEFAGSFDLEGGE